MEIRTPVAVGIQDNTASTIMGSNTGIKPNTAISNVPEVVTASGSQDAGSFGMTTLAHSIEHINQKQVSDAAVRAPRRPTGSTPVRKLQAFLDETVSGVSVTRKQVHSAVSPVDSMTVNEVIMNLSALNYDTRGTVKELKKRLRNHYKLQRIAHYHLLLPENMQFDFLVVIDFEATCAENDDSFVHEIIEFPAVLVDVRNQYVCSYFRSFCKPRVNPVLTGFCTSLTSITQAQVDKALDFPEVLGNFEQWLSTQLGTFYKFAVVTDGPWDMAKFFKRQLELDGLRLPYWARQWINIRKVFRAFHESDYVNLQQMLSKSGLEFQGRPHRGLDDALNIAAVTIKLMQEGCVFTFNEYFSS